MVSFNESRPLEVAARGLGAATGPTLLVNEVLTLEALGLAGSFSRSCFDFVSSAAIILQG